MPKARTPEPQIDKTTKAPPAPSEPVAEQVYAFESPVRCPRCKAPDTKRTSTKADTQYRECSRAVCRHKFTVKGRAI